MYGQVVGKCRACYRHDGRHTCKWTLDKVQSTSHTYGSFDIGVGFVPILKSA